MALSISESASRLGYLSRHINEGLNFIESLVQRIFGSVVDGGKTVGTHGTTNTTRGGDTTKTVKTYKTDDTIRSG